MLPRGRTMVTYLGKSRWRRKSSELRRKKMAAASRRPNRSLSKLRRASSRSTWFSRSKTRNPLFSPQIAQVQLPARVVEEQSRTKYFFTILF